MAKRKLTPRQREHIRNSRAARQNKRAADAADEASTRAVGVGHAGLILAHHGATVLVETPERAVVRCQIRQQLEALVCGDRVRWQPTEDREGVVTELLPRQSLIARPLEGGGSKPYAANVDRIFVVTATQPSTDDGLIDRYLVVAETTHIHPVIVINKTDLAQTHQQSELRARADKYRAIGYPVLFTSVKREHGLDEIFTEMEGHTSILVGQSGVGKSSLVKSLLPEEAIRIGALSERRQGRHTTTTSRLYHLPCGGDLIDSPGVRDFAVWHIDREDITHGFVDFRDYLGRCKFSNCSHTSEPGCALLEAVNQGKIDPQRLVSYHAMMRSIEQGRRM